jgi:hypothetical protein
VSVVVLEPMVDAARHKLCITLSGASTITRTGRSFAGGERRRAASAEAGAVPSQSLAA